MGLGKGIAGASASGKETISVSDVKKDPRFSREIDKALGFETRSILAVPILFKNTSLGTIEIINKRENNRFSTEEIKLVTDIARLLGALLALGDRLLAMRRQGLILVTGPTGSGKSTTLAAMINQINETRPVHIMTIEDPVEFVYEDKVATINQREVGKDTADFKMALRAALRQDPDVILMGEMRDQETIDIALHAAETGHLVFSTLHTNDAAQTIDRVKNIFPAESQVHIREMLALVLEGIISQRLVTRADGTGRAAAVEVLIGSPNIRDLIKAGDIAHIELAMAKAGSYYRMQTMNQALAALVQEDTVAEESALAISSSPDDLKLLLKGFTIGGGAATTNGKQTDGKSEEEAPPEPPVEEKPAEPEAKESGPRKFKISRGFKL